MTLRWFGKGFPYSVALAAIREYPVESLGSDTMDALFLIGFFVFYLVLNLFILPRMGVPT